MIDNEKSFISLGATLIPISILMSYYLNGKNNPIVDCIEEASFNLDLDSDIYEIFSDYDTNVASKYLESTMVEAGIGIPTVHDKYSYCYGRSTLGINYKFTVIYYNRNTEFDRIMMEELKQYYDKIITIDSKFKDLSNVEYSPIAKKLYRYKGEI